MSALKSFIVAGITAALLLACARQPAEAPTPSSSSVPAGKPVVYQVFTRLFGNTNTTNTPWGTLEENGVGKFSDFTSS